MLFDDRTEFEIIVDRAGIVILISAFCYFAAHFLVWALRGFPFSAGL